MIDLKDLPKDITYQILTFRNFLVASWPSLDKLMERHDWEEDGDFSDEWIQVNWEFLIERELLGNQGYLIPLVWCHRISSSSSEATHKVICDVKGKIELLDGVKQKKHIYNGEELLLTGFYSRYEEITFGLYPPFDFVDLRTSDKKKVFIVPFDSCKFILKPIQEV